MAQSRQRFTQIPSDFPVEDSDHAGFETAGPLHKQRPWPWIASTCLLAILLCASLLYQTMPVASGTYETGFQTDLEPSRKVMSLKEIQFYGGIVVNESGEFDLNLNPNGPRYTGHPTRELDAAWDEIVGKYIALNDREAAAINGEISKENGLYFVVPHVQHSLHCVNYLRKALYPRFYPTINEVKDNIPSHWTHIDHCIETLRETIQCNMDMTPVPHLWFEKKKMYIANTQLVHTCRDFDALQRWETAWAENVQQRGNS